MPTTIEQTTLEKPYRFKPIFTQVVSSTPGRLRLRVAHPHRQPEKIQQIASTLRANPKINQVRTNVPQGSITIQHGGDSGSLDSIFSTLRSLGIIFGDITQGKSEAAAGVSSAAFDLNKRVRQATNGVIDLRFLFPLGLATLSLRQLSAKGLQFDTIPWYVLAWYAFDSFIKLHANSTPGLNAGALGEE